MQHILHFTRQLGSKVSLSTSSSTSFLFNLQSIYYLTPLAPRGVYKSTISSPPLINDDTKSGD